MNDHQLAQGLLKGDEAAFKTLVETYQHMVFNAVFNMVQDYHESEDVAQEVFIQVYQSVQSFRGDSKLSTWLYRIAITKSFEWQRKRKAKKRIGLVKSWLGLDHEAAKTKTDFEHPGISLEKKENAAVLYKAIDKLPGTQKAAFILIKADGLSYEETAAILETTAAAVESLMHRAKQNLRKILKEHYR